MSEDIFSFIRNAFPNPEVCTVFEMGAADGKDTAKILEAIKPKAYYAFEPDPRNIATIKASSLMCLPEFHLIEAALGNGNGMLDFYLSGGMNPTLNVEHSFSSSLKRPKLHLTIHESCTFERTIQVPVMRLDDFCSLYSVGRIDFIWCDVQGAEDLVLEGGRKMFERTQYFYTEYIDIELYEGQLSCDEIRKRLPGHWDVVSKWESEVLFKNADWQ